MKTTIRRALGGLTAATVLIALIAGCETNSDVQSSDTTSPSGVLAISPTAATVTNNVTFTASGGTGVYIWSLVETNLGTLSASGPWAIYTAMVNTNDTNFLSQNIVIVMDDKGDSASATVTQN